MKAVLTSLTLLITSGFLAANDWPTWRGPDGDGKLPADADYPNRWSATENIAWRIDLPAPGNSSPIVSGGRIFLTVAENGGRQRSLLCFSADDGRELWKKTVDYGKEDQTHKTNPYCAASPVTDGGIVIAWHGNAGLHAYDFDGNEKWKRDLGSDHAHIWGPNAASPVILDDRVLISAGPGTKANLFALNKENGKKIWETPLPDAQSKEAKQFKGSWATPLIVKNGSRVEMLLGLPQYFRSFDPESGKEWWCCAGLGDLCYTNVVTGDAQVVYLCGYGGPGMGMKLPGPDETGDLTESHRLWADPPKGKGKKRNPQRIGSGQIVDDHLYLLNEPGAIECISPKTGETAWQERLSRKSWSSMNFVGGKLYINEMNGTTYVIDPSPEGLNVLETNAVDSNQHTNASPAFADGRIFLRTDTYLYAIGK